MKLKNFETKEIKNLTNAICDLYNNKEITKDEYNKICNNLNLILALYHEKKAKGINIQPKSLIEKFLRGQDNESRRI